MPLLPDGVISSQLPDGGVVDTEVSFRHHLFQIAVGEGVTEVPADADLVGEVPSTEQVDPFLRDITPA
jgi:hypothetical protein